MQLEAIKKQRQQAIQEQAVLEKQAGRLGAARLAAMLVVFLGVVVGAKESAAVYYILAVLALGIFVVLLFKHQQVKNQVAHAQEVDPAPARYADCFVFLFQDAV